MLSELSPSVLQSFPWCSVQAMVPVTAHYLRLFTQALTLLLSNYPELSSLVITFYSHLPLKTSLLLKTTVAAVTASSPKIPSEQSLFCTMPEVLAGEPPTYICLWVGQPVHSSHYPWGNLNSCSIWEQISFANNFDTLLLMHWFPLDQEKKGLGM